jgi:hypothetical protein
MEGGMWDKSEEIYPLLGAVSRRLSDWTFPSGMTLSFAHLQHEKDLLNYQGSEFAFIGFDEVTHFTEKMFWYMLSRNRSTCGVHPYVMASCNPDPNSWVAKMIEWWINQETGFAIKAREGVIRYLFRWNDVYNWADSKADLLKQFPFIVDMAKEQGVAPEHLIKSVTFIPGALKENQILLAKDPMYVANLMSLSEDERLRLADGNWKISLDKRMIADYAMVERVFDNYPDYSGGKYITVDAARFGRDFLVIFVWNGWEVVYAIVMKQSDTFDITSAIERMRMKFNITKAHVIIDQDGVGRNAVKLGNYIGFSGGASPRIDRDPKTQEGRQALKTYDNLKAQCVYRFMNLRVNTGQLRYTLTNDNCEIDGIFTTKIKLGGKVVDIRDLIKEDLRSYRRHDNPEETDDVNKQCIESKEIQKTLIGGRSPDFGDTSFMREYFALSVTRKGARL